MPDSACDVERHITMDQAWSDFQGGIFARIQQQLHYLQELGVDAHWLAPRLENCMFTPGNHGYGFQHVLAIEPRLSSDPEHVRNNPLFVKGEMCELLNEKHARNTYVIFAIVLHRVSDVFAYPACGFPAPWNKQTHPWLWHDKHESPNPAWSKASPTPPLKKEVPTWRKYNNLSLSIGLSSKSSHPSLSEARATLDGPAQVGTQITEVRTFIGRKRESTLKIVALEPNKRIVMKSESGPFPLKVTMTFESLENATRITLEADTEPKGILKLVDGMIAGMVKKELETDLSAAKHVVEAGT